MHLSKEAIEAAIDYSCTLHAYATEFVRKEDGSVYPVNLAKRIQQACEEYYERKIANTNQ